MEGQGDNAKRGGATLSPAQNSENRPQPHKSCLKGSGVNESRLATFTHILGLDSTFPWESGKPPGQGVGSGAGRNKARLKAFSKIR